MIKVPFKAIHAFISTIMASFLPVIMSKKNKQTEKNIPDKWKEANVAPIFKNGDKHKPSNYRPVSLTCITSEIIEHIIVANLMKHLEIQNITFPLQHGFGRNHSCKSQLLFLFQDLASSTTQTHMLVIDFSKAFDKVPHKHLNKNSNGMVSEGIYLSGS